MSYFTLEHLTNEVRWTLLAIGIGLVLASVISITLQRLRPEKNYTELRARIRTWWVIAILFGISIVLGSTMAVFFLAFVSLLSLREYTTLIPVRQTDRSALLLMFACVPFQYLWVYWQWYGMFVIFIPVYMFLLIPTRMVMIGDTQGFLRSIGTLHWGLMTTVFSLSHAAMLLVILPDGTGRYPPVWPSPEAMKFPGPGLLLFLMLLTQSNDIAQFMWGKSLGHRKVVPKVSPGKTLAGLLGGVFTTVVLATLLGPAITFLDWKRSMIAGLIIGIGGFAGDVSISAIKRDLGVKDSGDLLPGHGGILDRVDSLTYTAPLFFHFVYYCYC